MLIAVCLDIYHWSALCGTYERESKNRQEGGRGCKEGGQGSGREEGRGRKEEGCMCR